MPEAARKDGADTVGTGHGCDAITVTNEGSNNVFANNIGIVRKDDENLSHLVPSGGDCIPHTVPLSTYSSSVFINSLNAGRKGDFYGAEEITSGSPDVFIG